MTARIHWTDPEKNKLKKFNIAFLLFIILAISLALPMGEVAADTPGAGWTLKDSNGPRRSSPAMDYDSRRGVTVLFGGYDYVTGTTLGDTWEWNGSTWTQVATTGPPARAWCRMAYDSTRGVMVLFGGRDPRKDNAYADYGDTWEWNGSTWTQVFPSTSPSRRYYQGMAYDSKRGVTVLFGGNSSAGLYFGDTWEWNGSTWTQVATTGPAARTTQTMAYDSKRGMTVLFGGLFTGPIYFGDTWEWNGSIWQKVAATGPSGRCNSTMAFDSQRGVTVLFGGYNGNSFGDTWEWNGSGWTQTASTEPPPRSMAAMAYDSLRGVSVLFGGFSNFADTWEYTGPPIGNRPPVANAGPDQTVHVGQTAYLNGGGSSDPDGDALRYAWSFASRPTGSSAALSDTTAINPSFTPDKEGPYTLQLVVTDSKGASGTPDQVVVSTSNSPPVAYAGPNQSIIGMGATVQLDGTRSKDDDGDSLAYRWTLTCPEGSIASLSDSTSPRPTFVVDRPGTYIAQLVVSDGWASSAPSAVTITSENLKPVAKASANPTTVHAGASVQLDGSASSDPDGNLPLSYAWSFVAKPGGSQAILADPAIFNPTFVADQPGDYVVQLIVKDSLMAESAAATVTISTANSPPVADAGPDQALTRVNSVVTLNGKGTDPDGDQVTLKWSLSRPAGSTATLSNDTSPNPTFVADVPGEYVAQLKVSDPWTSSFATVTVSFANVPPVAEAKPDQVIQAIGDTVTVQGSGNDDNGDNLSYCWSIKSLPSGSSATAVPDLNQPGKATFVADVHGDYVLELKVTDSWGLSATDTMLVSFANVAPVANAGSSQSVSPGQTVPLNGSYSSDANGDPLTYKWSLTTKPPGSTATIAAPSAMTTSFVPDVEGAYVITLVVNDGFVDSLPKGINIQAVSQVTAVIASLQDLQKSVGDPAVIPDPAFKTSTMRNAFNNKLNAVVANIAAGNYQEALGQLEHDLLKKTDGFKGGDPKNDWLKTQEAQDFLYPELMNIINLVKSLM